MRRPSSDRTAAVVFGAGAIFCAVLFVRALTEKEIRSGLFTYMLVCIAAAIGLWLGRRWGRNLALILSIGNLGLGALTLLSVLMSKRGPVVGPVVLLVVSLGLTYWLSRPEVAQT